MNDDRLFDAQHAERFNFLIECLQQWWRGFGMQQRPRMRLESDHRRHGAGSPRPIDHGFHDQLMADVQAIKDAESDDRGPGDTRAIGLIQDFHQERQQRTITVSLFSIYHLTFLICYLKVTWLI